MTFKNMIFETDKKGLDNMLQFWNNPEGRINTEHTKSPINITVKTADNGYWIKIIAKEQLTRTTYDNLTLQLVYNNIQFHNIKFCIPQDQTENVERFLFNKKNKANGQNKYYLQHMRQDKKNNDEKKTYTAKISCHKTATKKEIINLTSFLRQYL